DTPWDIAFEPDGAALVTLRDQARIVRVRDGEKTTLTGEGASYLRREAYDTGEAGLLGIVLHPDDPTLVYVYLTRNAGNAVVRMRLNGDTSAEPNRILPNIPKASNHDGGRLAFGPGGYPCVTTGDAGSRPNSQKKNTLAGKILRVV